MDGWMDGSLERRSFTASEAGPSHSKRPVNLLNQWRARVELAERLVARERSAYWDHFHDPAPMEAHAACVHFLIGWAKVQVQGARQLHAEEPRFRSF